MAEALSTKNSLDTVDMYHFAERMANPEVEQVDMLGFAGNQPPEDTSMRPDAVDMINFAKKMSVSDASVAAPSAPESQAPAPPPQGPGALSTVGSHLLDIPKGVLGAFNDAVVAGAKFSEAFWKILGVDWMASGAESLAKSQRSLTKPGGTLSIPPGTGHEIIGGLSRLGGDLAMALPLGGPRAVALGLGALQGAEAGVQASEAGADAWKTAEVATRTGAMGTLANLIPMHRIFSAMPASGLQLMEQALTTGGMNLGLAKAMELLDTSVEGFEGGKAPSEWLTQFAEQQTIASNAVPFLFGLLAHSIAGYKRLAIEREAPPPPATVPDAGAADEFLGFTKTAGKEAALEQEAPIESPTMRATERAYKTKTELTAALREKASELVDPVPEGLTAKEAKTAETARKRAITARAGALRTQLKPFLDKGMSVEDAVAASDAAIRAERAKAKGELPTETGLEDLEKATRSADEEAAQERGYVAPPEIDEIPLEDAVRTASTADELPFEEQTNASNVRSDQGQLRQEGDELRQGSRNRGQDVQQEAAQEQEAAQAEQQASQEGLAAEEAAKRRIVTKPLRTAQGQILPIAEMVSERTKRASVVFDIPQRIKDLTVATRKAVTGSGTWKALATAIWKANELSKRLSPEDQARLERPLRIANKAYEKALKEQGEADTRTLEAKARTKKQVETEAEAKARTVEQFREELRQEIGDHADKLAAEDLQGVLYEGLPTGRLVESLLPHLPKKRDLDALTVAAARRRMTPAQKKAMTRWYAGLLDIEQRIRSAATRTLPNEYEARAIDPNDIPRIPQRDLEERWNKVYREPSTGRVSGCAGRFHKQAVEALLKARAVALKQGLDTPLTRMDDAAVAQHVEAVVKQHWLLCEANAAAFGKDAEYWHGKMMGEGGRVEFGKAEVEDSRRTRRFAKRGETIQGYIKLMENGDRIIRLTENADPTTFLHELHHAWEWSVPIAARKPIIKYINRFGGGILKKAGLGNLIKEGEPLITEDAQGNYVWSEGGSEAWARIGLKLVKDSTSIGKAPAFLRKPLVQLQRWLRTLWGGFSVLDSFSPPPAVRDAYWEMFSPMKGKPGSIDYDRVLLDRARRGQFDPRMLVFQDAGTLAAVGVALGQGADNGWRGQNKKEQEEMLDRIIEEGRFDAVMQSIDLRVDPKTGEPPPLNREQQVVLNARAGVVYQESVSRVLEHMRQGRSARDAMELAVSEQGEAGKLITGLAAAEQSEHGMRLQQTQNNIQAVHLFNAARGLAETLTKHETQVLKAALQSLQQGDPQPMLDLIARTPSPTINEYLEVLFYNGMLSRTRTQLSNIQGNLINYAIQGPLTHGAAALIDAAMLPVHAIAGTQRKYYFSDVLSFVDPRVLPFRSALGKAREVLATGMLPHVVYGSDEAFAKYSIQSARMLAFERSHNPLVRRMALPITAAIRVMIAVDTITRVISQGAYNDLMAKKAGMKDGSEYWRSLKTEDQKVKAVKFASRVTATEMPGSIVKHILRAFKVESPISWAGHFFLTFTNVASNLAKQGLELTPGAGLALEASRFADAHHMQRRKVLAELHNLAVKGELPARIPDGKGGFMENPKWREAYNEKMKGWKEKAPFYMSTAQEIAGRQLLGVLLTGMLATLMVEDENGVPTIQGAYPIDLDKRKALKERGILEHSFVRRLPDGRYHSISYTNLGPLGLPIGAAVSMVDWYKRREELKATGRGLPEDAVAEQQNMLELVHGLTSSLTNNMWAEDAVRLAEGVMEAGTTGQGIKKGALNTLGMVLGKMNPFGGIQRDLAMLVNMYNPDLGAARPELNTLLGQVAQVAPLPRLALEAAGVNIPVQKDRFGQPVKDTRVWQATDVFWSWLPYQQRISKNMTEVDKELERVGWWPEIPYHNASTGAKVMLKLEGVKNDLIVPPDLYAQFVYDYGRTLKARMEAAVKSPSYQAIPAATPLGVQQRLARLQRGQEHAAKPFENKLKAEVRRVRVEPNGRLRLAPLEPDLTVFSNLVQEPQ